MIPTTSGTPNRCINTITNGYISEVPLNYRWIRQLQAFQFMSLIFNKF